MSRVLLFVQTGDGRPKCLRAPTEYWDHPNRVEAQVAIWRAAVNPTNEPSATVKRLIAADRWWLVECPSADVGRVAISYYEVSKGAGPLPREFQSMSGNERAVILAQGGRP